MWQFYCIALFIVVVGLLLSPKDHNKKVLLICFGLFYLLQALRNPSIGTDTHSYIDIFYYVKYGGPLTQTRYEIGYIFFTKLITILFDDPQFLLVITSAFIIGGYALFVYSKSRITWLSAFLFFTAGLFRFSISGIRQNMAIILFLIAMVFLQKKQIIPYCLLIILASLFHSSALVLILLVFIDKIDYKKLKAVFIPIGIIGMILFPLLVRVFITVLPQYARYLNSIYNHGVSLASIMQFLISFTICVTCIVLFNQAASASMEDTLLMKLVILKTILMFLAIRLNAIDRLAEYLSPFEIVALPNMIAADKVKTNRPIIISAVIFAFIAYASVWYIGHPETQTVWPYKFFFQ